MFVELVEIIHNSFAFDTSKKASSPGSIGYVGDVESSFAVIVPDRPTHTVGVRRTVFFKKTPRAPLIVIEESCCADVVTDRFVHVAELAERP